MKLRRIVRLAVFLSLILLAQISTAQEFEYHIGNENLELNENGIFQDKYGICFEESLLLQSYDKIIKLREGYSREQDNLETLEVGNLNLLVAKRQSSWVKKKADKNCLSSDPNHCLVWCYVELPRRVLEIEIKDESKILEIEDFNESLRKLLIESGFIIFSETACEPFELNYTTIEKLDNYYNITLDEKIDYQFILQSFQIDNQLPIGGLNRETILVLDEL